MVKLPRFDRIGVSSKSYFVESMMVLKVVMMLD